MPGSKRNQNQTNINSR